MSIAKDLFSIANKLSPYIEFDSTEVESLTNAANDIGDSWSGSWLGYHSRVYYRDFLNPPAGARFSQEWGFKSYFSENTIGDWVEFKFDDVVSVIYKKAGNPNFKEIITCGNKAKESFEQAKLSVLSLIHSNFKDDCDKFFLSTLEKIESSKIFDEHDYIQFSRPTGQFMSRDMAAVEKGINTPPHIAVLAKVLALKSPLQACSELRTQINTLASHIQNLEKKRVTEERIGTNIFIGHGRSPFWRELKDFVNDRLGLPWDEFNRVPVAGVTNIARLGQMLDTASFAFLVMTAEDEQADGDLHARMNVIHEVGLFQGRLGFDRAIVLLEEGCAEFSNIQGLGQIRFPKGNISAIFEQIRQVLETRETL